MSRFSTFNYLISSYYAGKNEVEFFQIDNSFFDKVMNFETTEVEPSQKSIDAILNFASQYQVLKSGNTGAIELNLN